MAEKSERSKAENSRFLKNYAQIVQLSMKNSGLSSENFTYLRETQMDRCIDQLGENGKKLIAKLLYAIIGQDVHEIANFLNRSDMADRSIQLTASPSLCEQL